MTRFRLTNKTERLAARMACLPPALRETLPVLEHTNGSALYTYDVAGKPYAIAFWGTAARPYFHHSYRTEQQRQERIDAFRASVEGSVARKTEAAAQKAAWTNPLRVGHILYTSWGYDQTNVEFYTVTRVSGRRTWIAPIAAEYEAHGFMSGTTWPETPTRITGEETMHTAQPCGDRGAYLKINSSVHAWPETEAGRKHSTSSYA